MWKNVGVMRRHKDMKRFKDARDRGCAYLLTKHRSDGGFGIPEMGVADYYKALLAFGVCGQSNAASQLCGWIRTNGITPHGDFGPRPEDFGDYRYTYPNSWVIIGAHRLGNFDLSQKGMDFLMGFRDPESGGFYSSYKKQDADTEQNLIYVSFCGLAALYTGRIDVAKDVGGWMRNLMECQPNFPQKLFTVWSRTKGLITESDPRRVYTHVVSSNATSYQSFFQPGAASAFLVSLYLSSKENQWLELAMEYIRFAEKASDYLFTLVAAGKVGWACSLLYKLTRENKYKEMAIRIGDNIIAVQSKKGYWNFPGTNTPDNGITAEMIVWLDAMHQAVGHE